MQTKHLFSKSGARVTAIHSAAHSTYKGVASWYFLGDMEFTDGVTLDNREIPPYLLCADHDNHEAKDELDKVLAVLSKHLSKQGKWHDMKHTRDGRCYSWTPKKNEAVTPVK